MGRYHKNEQGYTLLLSLLALVLLSILTMGVITVTSTSINTSSNENKNQSAYYLAEAGIVLAQDMIDQIAKKEFQLAQEKLVIFNKKLIGETDPEQIIKVEEYVVILIEDYYTNILKEITSKNSWSTNNFTLSPGEKLRQATIEIVPDVNEKKKYGVISTGKIEKDNLKTSRKLTQIINIRELNYDKLTTATIGTEEKLVEIPGVNGKFYIDDANKTIIIKDEWSVSGNNVFPDNYNKDWTLIVEGNFKVNNNAKLHFPGNLLIKGGGKGKEAHLVGNNVDVQIGGALFFEGNSFKANSSGLALTTGAFCAPNATVEFNNIVDKEGKTITLSTFTYNKTNENIDNYDIKKGNGNGNTSNSILSHNSVFIEISSQKTTGNGTSTLKITGEKTTTLSTCSILNDNLNKPTDSTQFELGSLDSHIHTEQSYEID